MFARVVEGFAKPGKRDEINKMLTNEFLPLIKQQHGFMDAIGVTDSKNPDHHITMVLWNTPDDAERFYATKEYTSKVDRLTTLVERRTVHDCTVDTSTFHKIAAVHAA